VASTVTWVITIDLGSDPPMLGTSSLASPGTALTSFGSRVASPGPATSWALTPALAAASLILSRSVATWNLTTQAASSAGVYIIKATPDLSALMGVRAASSTLCLWLSSKQTRQIKERGDH
jgi:hypothetical protein